MLTTILLILALVVLAIISYIIWEFIIKINLTAKKLQKMDPSLKIYTVPFTGLLGVQKKCIEKYGDSHQFVKDMVR